MNISDNKYKVIIFYLFFSLILSACSVEKTNPFSKTYHNLTARYNAYFIANEHMKDVEQAIKKNQERNFNKILKVFPTIDSTVVAGKQNELEECYKKASVAIQRHPNSDWVDDCYILIGKTRFYQGEYMEAIDLFKFVNVNSKDDKARHAALINLMRTFIDLREFSNAIYVSDFLKKEKLSRENLKDLYLIRAYLFQEREDHSNMVKNLVVAAPMVSKKEGKAKMYFILGQLYQETGFDAEAYKYYNECLKSGPDYELSFYAKLNIAQVTELSDGSDVKKVRKYFRGLVKDRKNLEFRDKIYYEMAEFEFKQDNLKEAAAYLHASVDASVNNPRQKGYSYLRLGELHFDRFKEYQLAKNYYDSAVNTLPVNDEQYLQIKGRQEILTEFVEQVNVIQNQDSLLALSDLDSVQLMAFINSYIDEKTEEEERQKQKNEGKQKQSEAGYYSMGGQSGLIDADNNTSGSKWYFYNPAAIGIGRNEFIKNWGRRKLEDNWRRSNKEPESGGFESVSAEPAAGDLSPTVDPSSTQASTAYDPGQLFAAVPRTPEAKRQSLDMIESAYFKLGNIYNFKLNEKTDAAATFETLIKRFPASGFKPEALYQLHLIYKDSINGQAVAYKEELIRDFPNSIYTKLLVNPNYREESAAASEQLQRLYAEAYNHYLADSLDQALKIIHKGLRNHPDNSFTDNLKLLEILIVGKTDGVYNYQYALTQFLEKYPDSDLVDYARNLLESIDSFKMDALRREGAQFQVDEEQIHYFVLAYQQTDQIAERLISRVDRFVKGHEKELRTANMTLDNARSVILVNEFSSKDNALEFYGQFHEDGSVLGELKNYNINTFVITKDNFEKLYSTKSLEYYVSFFNKNYL